MATRLLSRAIIASIFSRCLCPMTSQRVGSASNLRGLLADLLASITRKNINLFVRVAGHGWKEKALPGQRFYKYLDYDLLVSANKIAIRERYNRALDMHRLPINKTEVYPVLLAVPHEYADSLAMRCMIQLNRKGTVVYLDMPIDKFMLLPEWEVKEGDADE